MLSVTLTTFFILFGIGIYRYVLYPSCLSPLSKIPSAGPLCAFSSIWILWIRFTDQEVRTVNAAFQRHGPVIRLGPDELAVNCIDGGIRTVHGGGFRKSQWYDFFMNYGKRNTFSALGSEHAMRRRRVSNVYTKTCIQTSPHVQAIVVELLRERFLPILAQSAYNGITVNILDLSFAYGLDFVSAYIFGISRSTNFLQQSEIRQHWLTEYHKSHPSEYMVWLQELPNLTYWLRRAAIYVVPKWYTKADEELDKWALVMVDSTDGALQVTQTDKGFAAGDRPLVYEQLKMAMTEEVDRRKPSLAVSPLFDPEQQRLELASECLDHMVATRDTFGITFTYVIYEISRHPDIQQRLQHELRSLDPPLVFPLTALSSHNPHIPSPKSIEALPLLRAVIKESLRLRGTVPTPNPRLTPRNTTTKIGPYDNIPPGVRISAFAWCLHRNEQVFPNPEEWRPERWMCSKRDSPVIDGEVDIDEKDRWFWAFGSGSRVCMGRNLAMEMIRYGIVAIYTNFTTKIVSDESFGADGSFVTGKPGEQLILSFEPLRPNPRCSDE